MKETGLGNLNGRACKILCGAVALIMTLSFFGCTGRRISSETKKKLKVKETKVTEESTTSEGTTSESTEDTTETSVTAFDIQNQEFPYISPSDFEAALIAYSKPEKMEEQEFFDLAGHGASLNAYCMEDKYLEGEPFNDLIWIDDGSENDITLSINYMLAEQTTGNTTLIEYNQFKDAAALKKDVETIWQEASETQKQITTDPHARLEMGENYVYYIVEGLATLEIYVCDDCLITFCRVGKFSVPDSLTVFKNDLGLLSVELSGGPITITPTPTPTPIPTHMPLPDETITDDGFLEAGLKAFDAEEVDKDTIEKNSLIGDDFCQYCVSDEYVETYHFVSLSGTNFLDRITKEIVFVCDQELNGTPVELAAGYYVFETAYEADATFEQICTAAMAYQPIRRGELELYIYDDYIYLYDSDVLLQAAYVQENVLISIGGIFNREMPTPIIDLVRSLDLPLPV